MLLTEGFGGMKFSHGESEGDAKKDTSLVPVHKKKRWLDSLISIKAAAEATITSSASADAGESSQQAAQQYSASSSSQKTCPTSCWLT